MGGPLLVTTEGDDAAPSDRPGRRRKRIARDVTRRGLFVEPSANQDPRLARSGVAPSTHPGLGWVGEGASPNGMKIDPLELTAIVATLSGRAAREIDPAEPPLVRFRGTSDLEVDGTQRGVWMPSENGVFHGR